MEAKKIYQTKCAKCGDTFQTQHPPEVYPLGLLCPKCCSVPEAWDREESVFEAGEQAGMRKVVKWVERQTTNRQKEVNLVTFDYRSFLSFLKENGIDEKE